MKTVKQSNKKDFVTFKKECLRLQKEWQLNSWTIRFEYKDLGTSEARMQADFNNHNSSIALSTKIQYGEFQEVKTRQEYVKDLAKHEMLHLLLRPVTFIGEARWATDSEFVAQEEGLVRKLMDIIK